MGMIVPLLRRKTTPTEALYLALHDSFEGADHQFVIEGNGRVESPVLADALRQACAATWEARVVYRRGYWVETKPSVPLRTWEKRPARWEKTVPRVHPIVVNQIKEEDDCLVFQIFHGLMDGRGALLWIANVFRALRKEPLVETQPGLTDQEFVPLPEHQRGKTGLQFHRLLADSPAGAHPSLLIHQSHSGTSPHLLPKLVCVLATSLCARGGQFLIPVDLRRHRPGISSAANLTLPLFLSATSASPWRQILGRLLWELKGRQELASLPSSRWLSRTPLFVYRLVLRAVAWGQRRARAYAVTAVVSMLGRVELAAYSTPGFGAARLVALPLRHPLVAVSVLTLEVGGKTELALTSAGIVGPIARNLLGEGLERLWEEETE